MKDILIIGAGPVGLYAWNTAGLMDLNGYIVDNNKNVGGQPAQLYPNNNLYDFPGIQKIKAIDFINNQLEQALNNAKNIKLKLNVFVEEINKIKNYFEVKLNTKEILKVKTILFSTGNGSFVPNKLDEKWNYQNVFYLDEKIKKEHKTITVLGGGDSALSSSLKLINENKKVNLLHHREKYRALKENFLTQLQKKDNFTEINDTKIIDIIENQNSTLTIKTDKSQAIITDAILVQYGSKMQTSNIHNFGLKFHKSFKLCVDSKMQTNIDGIFAVGNIAFKENKYYNIMSGIGETVNCLYNISKYLNGPKYFLNFYSQK